MGESIGCEIAVVGGGTAGCVIAGRLAAESDAHVILLEAGPDYGPRGSGRWPPELLDGGALATSHDWGYGSGPLPGREPMRFQRARVIGGCSAHNGCVVAVGCREDYDGWAELADEPGWSADAIGPVLARVLDRLRVRVYTEDELAPFHRACLAAAAACGFPRADDLHDLDGGTGFGVEPVNVDRGTRVSTAFAYLDPARGRPQLSVLDRVLVDRLAPARSHVEVIGRREGVEIRVRADRVVLAAGAFGTPAILLRSGVGEPAELEALGVAPLLDLPGVGRNLHDHPVVEVVFEPTEELRAAQREAERAAFTPEEQTLGKLRSSRSTGPYDLHLVPVAAYEHSVLAGRMLIAAAALEPRSRGRLLLASADPEAPPAIDHRFLSDPEGHDRAVLREGLEHVRRFAAAEPLASLLDAETVPGPGADPETAISAVHTHYFHPVGTCAMGRADDPLAVCDGRGRVHGLDRVVVADCSLLPVVPRANTNVPAVLVGERIADWLLAPG